MKRWYRCTLSDVAPAMLARSRTLNPECEHVAGDMRTLRLGRAFDAVLVHDAVVYMVSEDDLRAAALTAFVHTRPGGVAIFAPDCVRETFRDSTELYQEADGARALRCVEWTWDPDPTDDTYAVDYAFLMRQGGVVKAAHDHHVEGLFSRDTWTRVLEGAGYLVEPLSRPVGEGEFDQVFLCRRLGGPTACR
jgi:trans-aconitate methyltransferase